MTKIETSIDSKEIKRGACFFCEDCTNFEWQVGAKNSLGEYCGCLPVKHHKSSQEQEADEISRNDNENDYISVQEDQINHELAITSSQNDNSIENLIEGAVEME